MSTLKTRRARDAVGPPLAGSAQPVAAVLTSQLRCCLALLLLSPWSAVAGCADAPTPGVDWTECEKHRLILRETDLAGAHFGGADFNGTDFQRANLSGADLSRASVDRARLSGADLTRAKMVQLSGYRSNFSDAKLAGADLTKAELTRANFHSANLSGANLRKAELQRTVFEGANLNGANLTGADLARANLTQATLVGTRMTQSRTFRTRIDGVDLSQVVGLTQAQLDAACGDVRTRLPAALKAAASWPCAKDD